MELLCSSLPLRGRFPGLGPEKDAACWVHGAAEHSPETSSAQAACFWTHSWRYVHVFVEPFKTWGGLNKTIKSKKGNISGFMN